MVFPKMLTVRQKFTDRRLADIPNAVKQELQNQGFAGRVKVGATIVIGVGSRGIANIATITRAVVDYWKAAGAQPFIVPAMGSHGAATAEGQADVLAHYGIIEETMGCPIRSSLDVIPIGTTPEGIDAFLDKHASAADGIMMIGRIKWHTDFEGKIESGLFKMMAIGLGKWAGAQTYHAHAYNLGMEKIIRSIGRQMLATGKIIGGLAILEDAYHNTAQVTAVPAAGMETREEALLEEAKSWMAKIPVMLDLLVVDEIGKEISGAGMDTKIVNRGTQGQYNPWKIAPVIHRIFIRSLSKNTYGNGSGMGMADVVSERLVKSVDLNATYINVITSSSLACGRIPMYFATDQECLENLRRSTGKLDPTQLRIGRIRNTMELTPIILSENLREEIEANPLLEIVSEAYDLEFDADGNLVPIRDVAISHELREVSQHASR